MSIPLWFIFNFGATFLVTGFAMWRGGGPERVVGLLLLGITITTFLLPDRRWMDVQYGVMWLDIAFFASLVVLALLADRWWTLIIAALQGVCVLLHLAFWAQMKITSLVYSVGLNLIGHMLLITLLVGTISHMLRKRREAKAST
ncbi:MAG: hypothetical protein Q7T61_20195 [Caulobacter sp.]|nr:hypothetical protein [Caulobacter sp.]